MSVTDHNVSKNAESISSFSKKKPDLQDRKMSTIDIHIDHIRDLKSISMFLSDTTAEKSCVDGLTISVVPEQNSTLGNLSMKNDSQELPSDNFDEFFKFIKADQCEERGQQHAASEIENKKEIVHESIKCSTNPKNEALVHVDLKSSKSIKQEKLRICAFCQKKETEKKTFKRCSRCKEENFPVHRYYCSRNCLVEDWTESHQAEHLKKQKHWP